MKFSSIIVFFSGVFFVASANGEGVYLGGEAGLAGTGWVGSDADTRTGLQIVDGARLKESEQISYDDQDTSNLFYGIYAGYHFSPRISMELSFSDFGTIDADRVEKSGYRGGFTDKATYPAEIGLRTATLIGRYTQSLTDQLSAFGQLGLAWSRQDVEYHDTEWESVIENGVLLDLVPYSVTRSDRDSHLDVTYGAGLAYALSESLTARLALRGIELMNGRLIDLGLGIQHSF